MVGVHIGHNCSVGNDVIIANNVLLAGNVEILDQAFVGGGTTFHQNMRARRLVMVQGSSAFGKNFPPFTLAGQRNMVFGLNIVGLRRAKFSAGQRDEIKRALQIALSKRAQYTTSAGQIARSGMDGSRSRIFRFRRHRNHEARSLSAEARRRIGDADVM